jgi:hypothetical protein
LSGLVELCGGELPENIEVTWTANAFWAGVLEVHTSGEFDFDDCTDDWFAVEWMAVR